MTLNHSSRKILFIFATSLSILIGMTLTVAGQENKPQSGESSDEQPDHRFGIVEAFWEADEAAELGVGWDRILFYWNEIQPTGPDDWNTLHVLEEWLDDARVEDRLVMGLLKNTPAWATDAEPFSGIPRGLYLPIDDPENLWAGYVRKVVDYYAPLGVHHWIVWNEPEIEAGVYGHEFSGSTRDYYQLLKVAYQVAKDEDPEAVIHLAGWSYWHDPAWLGQFLGVATADPDGAANNYFFDIITLHIYFRVETVEELIQETWAIQRRYGVQKPIWINETNASPNLDPLWPVERPNFQVDLDQQAWFIVQAHALGFGANATSIGIYKLLDILLPPGGESFGILRPDGSRRPAFDAYRTTIKYLSGFSFPVGRQQEEDYYSFAFQRSDSVTRILWSRQSNDLVLKVPALADEARVVSALGDTETVVQAYRGHYRIRLRGARCTPACDIGGPPVFLIEETVENLDILSIPTIAPDTAIRATATPTPTALPPTATLDDATLATREAALEASPTAADTPTSTETPTASPTITASPSPSPSPTAEPTSTAITPPTAADHSQPTSDANATTVVTSVTSSGQTSIGGGLASWFFIGAAVLLGGILAVLVVRHRQS